MVEAAAQGPAVPAAGGEKLTLDQLTLVYRDRTLGGEYVYLAPDIPQAVFLQATQGYLPLQPDELLLAIIGVSSAGSRTQGCALTTKRIYWPAAPTGSIHFGQPNPSQAFCADYQNLGELRLAPDNKHALELSPGGQRIILDGGPELPGALQHFLELTQPLRSASGALQAVNLTPAEEFHARQDLPKIQAWNALQREVRAQVQDFQRRTFLVSRTPVTTLLAGFCFFVFAAMVVAGVSFTNPAVQDLVKWGCNFGPSIVLDHQYWRLFTAMFIHIGLIHLGFNMYCLVGSGPTIERFYGHAGYLLLYILSGIGASLASLAFHPLTVSAGASGAIFGLFGGLLGYLAINYRAVPAAVLTPLRSSALSFVAFNTVLGAMNPAIDTAAHLGGLATGFVFGLLFTAVALAGTRPRHGEREPVLKAVLVGAVVSALLGGLGWFVCNRARTTILENPKVAAQLHPKETAAAHWNSFSTASAPALQEFDSISRQINQVLSTLDDHQADQAAKLKTIFDLAESVYALKRKVAAVPAGNAELVEIRNQMAGAATQQTNMLKSLEQFVLTGDQNLIEGPGGFLMSEKSYSAEFATIQNLANEYFQKHHLVDSPPAP